MKCCALNLVLATALFLCSYDQTKASSPGGDDGVRASPILKDAKSDAFLRGQFRVGYYLYLYKWEQAQNPEIRDMDAAINQMADMGFNYVYLGGVKDNQTWEDALKVCAERGMGIIAQLEGGMYLTKDSNIDNQAEKAAAFIEKYKDHPAVISFLVKEEPSADFLPRIQEYYTKVLEKVPDAPLYLLHSSLNVAQVEPTPHPLATGTDRYAFWWEFGLNGNRATPASALKWFHTQLNAYQQLAAQRGQSFEAVFTDCAAKLLLEKEALPGKIYPASAESEQRQKTVDRILRLADAGNQGVSSAEDGQLQIWKYYRPPANCTSAMAWLSVMEGAEAISIWSWGNPKAGEGGFWSQTLGWQGHGTPSLLEFSTFAKEIRPFGRLFRGITKDAEPVGEFPDAGHEALPEGSPQNPVLELPKDIQAQWRSFSVPGFLGKIVVLVNTKVGEWSDGRSPVVLKEQDLFRIDGEGNLVDYTPHYLPREIPLHLRDEGMEVTNLSTGKVLSAGETRNVVVNVQPGRGVILFLTPKGSGELPELAKAFNLPSVPTVGGIQPHPSPAN